LGYEPVRRPWEQIVRQRTISAKTKRLRSVAIWIQYRLCFGRFLNFTTTVVKAGTLPKNLTERRFRTFWEQTEERKRAELREL